MYFWRVYSYVRASPVNYHIASHISDVDSVLHRKLMSEVKIEHISVISISISFICNYFRQILSTLTNLWKNKRWPPKPETIGWNWHLGSYSSFSLKENSFEPPHSQNSMHFSSFKSQSIFQSSHIEFEKKYYWDTVKSLFLVTKFMIRSK